jgi:hypothetical protein
MSDSSEDPVIESAIAGLKDVTGKEVKRTDEGLVFYDHFTGRYWLAPWTTARAFANWTRNVGGYNAWRLNFEFIRLSYYSPAEAAKAIQRSNEPRNDPDEYVEYFMALFYRKPTKDELAYADIFEMCENKVEEISASNKMKD